MSSKNETDTKRARRSHRRPPRSLVFRLTLWSVVSSFGLVCIATGLLYFALAKSLDGADDRLLADRADNLGMLLRYRAEDVRELEWETRSGSDSVAPSFARILDAEGHTLVESPGMSDVLPSRAFPKPTQEPVRGRPIPSLKGRSFRGISTLVGVGSTGAEMRIVQLAVDRAHEERLLAAYRERVAVVLLATFVIGCGAALAIARRGIRPVQEIAAAADRIRSSTLHERIETERWPVELAALAATFNEMLERLEDSFTRLVRFSADIAHELRTPLNTLRGVAELALTASRSPEEYRDALGECLEDCTRLSQLIDRLLFIARSESAEAQIASHAVDLTKELASLRDFYEAAASAARVDLAMLSGAGVEVSADRSLLQRALGNLIDNALAHTPPGGRIVVRADRTPTHVIVEVADSGAGIAPEHVPHLFDRFYRIDDARSRASGGAGLGLSIVQSIMKLHGGSVAIESELGRGTHVMLSFPREQLPSR